MLSKVIAKRVQAAVSSGFTLIELLVVITIIGILSTVLLVATKSSRDKGKDGTIKQDLHQLRSQAALYFDDYNNFGTGMTTGSCPTTGGAGTMFQSTKMAELIADVKKRIGGSQIVTCSTLPTSGTATSWAVSAPLQAQSGQNWCVDSAGKAGSQGSLPANGSC